MPRKESILKQKSEVFATRIIKLYKYLSMTHHESVIGFRSLQEDNEELIKILVSSIKTMKQKTNQQ